MDGYHDTLGRTVRTNLILARDFNATALLYETDLAHLAHARNTAAHCRLVASDAIRRCRSIIARRFASEG